jgi:hypothetical protein
MSTTADIQKYGRNRDGYIEYFIKVVHNGKVWGIKKRFSEFVQLNEFLIKSGYGVPPSLPKKTTVWKKVDDKLLQKRSKALQVYINDLLKTFSVADNSLLKEFLEVEVNWLKSAKQQSFKKVQRMDLIPLAFSKLVIQIPVSRVKTSPFLRGGGAGGGGGLGGGGMGMGSSFSISVNQSNMMANKTKSLSFSMLRSPSRKESFPQPDPYGNGYGYGNNTASSLLVGTPQFSAMKDRKFSMDLFNNLSTNSMSHDAQYALQSAVKKTSFIKATDTLWMHYKDDIEQLCEEGDEDIEYDSSYFDLDDQGPPSGMLLKRPGGDLQNKAKIMTMASLTRQNPVDYAKMTEVLATPPTPTTDGLSTGLLCMKDIAIALINIESKFIQSHMQWDLFGWNEEAMVVHEFDQVPRLLEEKDNKEGDDQSVGKISTSSTS